MPDRLPANEGPWAPRPSQNMGNAAKAPNAIFGGIPEVRKSRLFPVSPTAAAKHVAVPYIDPRPSSLPLGGGRGSVHMPAGNIALQNRATVVEEVHTGSMRAILRLCAILFVLGLVVLLWPSSQPSVVDTAGPLDLVPPEKTTTVRADADTSAAVVSDEDADADAKSAPAVPENFEVPRLKGPLPKVKDPLLEGLDLSTMSTTSSTQTKDAKPAKDAAEKSTAKAVFGGSSSRSGLAPR